MAEAKLKPLRQKVSEYIASLPKERQADCQKLNSICKKITGKTGAIWYGGIVGYGKYSYKYPTGHSGECFPIGFSSRKAALTIYMMSGLQDQNERLKKLGKYKAGKGCLYIKSLDDIDEKVLTDLMLEGYKKILTTQKK